MTRADDLRRAIAATEARAEVWEAKGGPIRSKRAETAREAARLWRLELDECGGRMPGEVVTSEAELPAGWALCSECHLPHRPGSLTKVTCMPCIVGNPRVAGPDWWQPGLTPTDS